MLGLLILHHPDDRYFGEELARVVAQSAPDLTVRVLEAPLADAAALAAFAAALPAHERSILVFGVGLEGYIRGGVAADPLLAAPVSALLAAARELSVANIGLMPLEASELPPWWAPLATLPQVDTPMGAGPPDDADTGSFQPPQRANGGPRAPSPSFSMGESKSATQTGGSGTPPLLYVSYPNVLTPQSTPALLVYVYELAFFNAVQQDRAKRLGDARIADFGQAQNVPTEAISAGSRLTAVPRITGCAIDPGMLTLEWQGEWVCAPFVVKPGADLIQAATPRELDGEVTFYIGPVIVGEVRFSVNYSPDQNATLAPAQGQASPYQKVFASYSHRDTALVEQLEGAYKALGMEYLRDAMVLRSGEEWNARLLELIDEAEIFQLCWSEDASKSKYVEQEWRHALGLQRKYFVRPMYWAKPLAKPPDELSHLHFAFLSLP